MSFTTAPNLYSLPKASDRFQLNLIEIDIGVAPYIEFSMDVPDGLWELEFFGRLSSTANEGADVPILENLDYYDEYHGHYANDGVWNPITWKVETQCVKNVNDRFASDTFLTYILGNARADNGMDLSMVGKRLLRFHNAAGQGYKLRLGPGIKARIVDFNPSVFLTRKAGASEI